MWVADVFCPCFKIKPCILHSSSVPFYPGDISETGPATVDLTQLTLLISHWRRGEGRTSSSYIEWLEQRPPVATKQKDPWTRTLLRGNRWQQCGVTVASSSVIDSNTAGNEDAHWLTARRLEPLDAWISITPMKIITLLPVWSFKSLFF